ncbi:VOC family protein [Streptomyces sp. NPDC048436]|uniref:VOC family protein n=1 Tax=Streptomyces sp. NPDC048436 TaxID=3365550 RepID=UPI00371BB19E
MPHASGNNAAVFLDGEDAKPCGYFERLSAGGTVTLPLERQSWGDDASSLVDQFGITWMVNVTQQPR